MILKPATRIRKEQTGPDSLLPGVPGGLCATGQGVGQAEDSGRNQSGGGRNLRDKAVQGCERVVGKGAALPSICARALQAALCSASFLLRPQAGE